MTVYTNEEDRQTAEAISLLFNSGDNSYIVQNTFTGTLKTENNASEYDLFNVLKYIMQSVMDEGKPNKNNPTFYELPAKILVRRGTTEVIIITKNKYEIKFSKLSSLQEGSVEINEFVELEHKKR